MKEPVYFLKLELENVRCFGEKATLDLSDGDGNWKKWTVILGDNGTGKTSILQILLLLKVREEVSVKTQKVIYIPEIIYYVQQQHQSFKSEFNIKDINININIEYSKNAHKENGTLSIQNDLGIRFNNIIPILYIWLWGNENYE